MTSLQLDSPERSALLRFDLAGIDTTTVQNATLRLYNINSSTEGGNFHVATGPDWNQNTVTWNTAPAVGALLGSIGSVSTDTWYEVDVTGAVLGDPDGLIFIRTANFGTTNGAYYASLEHISGNAPELVLDLSAAPVPDTEDPTAPTGLVASGVTSSSVTLDWGPSSDNVGVVAYDIYRGGGLIGTVPGASTTYVDNTVAPETFYQYYVEARDAAGNTSPASNTVDVTTPAGPTIITLNPTDDASIHFNSPDSNYGSGFELDVDGGTSVKDFVMKFDVNGIGTSTVTDVRLRLYVTNSSSFGGEVRFDSDVSWDESTVTWNTAPPGNLGTATTLGSVVSGTWVEIDLTAWITSDGLVTLRFGNSPTSNGAGYSSSEALSNNPELVITTSG